MPAVKILFSALNGLTSAALCRRQPDAIAANAVNATSAARAIALVDAVTLKRGKAGRVTS